MIAKERNLERVNVICDYNYVFDFSASLKRFFEAEKMILYNEYMLTYKFEST